MSAPVFLADDPADPSQAAGRGRGLGDLRPGATFVLGGAEGRHAAVVQRRRAGERVDVVDGRGTRMQGVVEQADRDGLVLRVEAVVVEPVEPVRLVLVQALAKGDRDDLAIEAATEIGVDAIVPWQADRSVVVWRGDRAAKAHARWVSTVRAAAKQARRATVPDVRDVVDSKALARRVEETVAGGGAVLVLHEDAVAPLARTQLPASLLVLTRGSSADADAAPGAATVPVAERAPVPEILVVVGPEGGISDGELERLAAVGARTVLLGPHVLRTSTAGPVALALLCERLGRWG